MKYKKEYLVESSIRIIAFSTIAILAVITLFIFSQGMPFFFGHTISGMVLGLVWTPKEGVFGIFPMIVGSILITIGALAVGVPLGIACAIYLAEFTHKRVRAVLKPTIELLAGIPSVVYGFIGIVVLAPFVRIYLGGSGLSILTASVVLGIMILPTVISVSVDALLAVPHSYKEGSIALGATEWQTIYRVLLPAAKSGILAGVILGLGRAIGETMAVIMISGNAVKLPGSPLDSVRTLTSHIALEMGYAMGDHRSALFASAIILFLFILTLNVIAMSIMKRRIK
ncbi:phosphate ABC transporter permease subunit PstC [Candidatus Gottesmanbacteria bacterium RIFCSPLOWO2_01_FULL_46_9]|uniref:Phosphate transport system permease protein n=1 Tax=Candidatus Gottesmanbacteria bacterium RIFCSPLOWO2_01_FULL_46_9 TaxID=1798394 RepID=A0A1F6B343_9BACT|nr:MAG: phosphate ABC transporter permease subunit PstC [Candidatus Gottesmanbacteria bacterium RIFCSPLOWO2_01_FULL_46_9]